VTDSGRELQPSAAVARRWTVIASGLLLLSLALVVIYTRPVAFQSPIALVVVSAIGVAALFLQVRFRRELPRIHPPLGLTILGIVCAIVSFFADFLRLSRLAMEWTAFSAVICFGISGSLILHSLGKLRRQKSSAE
jgi:FtsH-binding integral membrane protein